MAYVVSGCENKITESSDKESYPLQVALYSMGKNFQNDISSLNITQNVNSRESPSEAVVTIEELDLLDDSVSAEKTIFKMNYSDNRWQIVSKEKKQRCWPGRGHQEYSDKLCL